MHIEFLVEEYSTEVTLNILVTKIISSDHTAIRAEYEKIPDSLSQQAKFRNPDAIKGGTWEQLDRILKKYGYETGLQKIDFAQRVTPHMDIEKNQSKSFQVFRDGLRKIIN